MPFLLYKVDGDNRYHRKRKVSLAGKRGPFFRHMEETCPQGGRWHLPEARLLELLKTDNPSQHALVIDLKPSVANNVSLYRLRNVWGYRCKDWAPLALQLEVLFSDKREDNPDAFKRCFGSPPEEGDLVHEFLHLGKNWNWGWGRINGTLLWPGIFRYFVGEIQKAQGNQSAT